MELLELLEVLVLELLELLELLEELVLELLELLIVYPNATKNVTVPPAGNSADCNVGTPLFIVAHVTGPAGTLVKV
jgi:hypothetical protein